MKDAKSINARDVNRALEVLRLQGKTDIVENLRRELGATHAYNRDAAGRFAPAERDDWFHIKTLTSKERSAYGQA